MERRNRHRVLTLGALALIGCGSDDGGGSGPARIDVVIATSQATFGHADQSAGRTAKQLMAAVRDLTLIADSGEPWLIVGRSQSPAFVSLEPGARNLIGVVLAKQVVRGHFTRARLVMDWLRFEIPATLHAVDGATPGTLTAVVVTSDGPLIADEPRDAGYHVLEFSAGSSTTRFTGSAAVPEHVTTAGTEWVLEQGDYVANFPIDLRLDSGDGVLTIDVNTFESVRWTDVAQGDNSPGVYDLTTPLSEPFVQLGGNQLDAAFRKR
jgi:hypothetical protein